MSTTESRTGFRLPWSGDGRRPDEGSADPSEATEVAADGSGPTVTTDAADAGVATAPEGAAPVAAAAPNGHDLAWPAADAVTHGASADQADGIAAATAPSAPPSRPHRANPLVAGLVKAMREAAETARAETVARVAASATTEVEAIHHASGEEAEALRRKADEEISGIRDWSKAEMDRIRAETEARITRRRELLEAEVEAHAASVERRIDAVREAVASFEEKMAAFFERLFAEDDPARLATLAEQMPEPPELETLAAAVASASLTGANEHSSSEPSGGHADATSDAHLEADDAAAAEAEALAAVELDGVDDETADAAPPLEMAADHPVAERLAVLTTPVHAQADGDDTMTRVTVVGLVNIASISIFKRALAKMPDVRTVSVTSGPDGDFVFSVTHGARTDLAAAIPAVSGFDARITGESDGALAVTARDPEA